MENELEYFKQQLENINLDLQYFWEEHFTEKDPGKILVLWGRLQFMMGIKMTSEMNIERIEEGLKHGRE